MYKLADISAFESLTNNKSSYGMMVFNTDKKPTKDSHHIIKGNVRVSYGKKHNDNKEDDSENDWVKRSMLWDDPELRKSLKPLLSLSRFNKMISKSVPLKDLQSILDEITDNDIDTMEIAYGDGDAGDVWSYKRNADDPEDTVTRWREELRKDPKFKRLLYSSSMADDVRDVYEQLPEEDRLLPDESDTYESWVDKMGANPIFKRAEIVGRLPSTESAIYELHKEDMPEIADDDTYDTWHKKLEDNEAFRKLRLFSQLPADKIQKIILRSLPEAEASDTVDTWLKKMDQ